MDGHHGRHKVVGHGTNLLLIVAISLFFIVTQRSNTHGFILRLQCKSTINFSISKPDVILQGSVIATFMFLPLHECQAKCMFNADCQSINYQKQGDHICELNKRTTEDIRYVVELTPRSGWIYMTTDHNYGLIGDVCKMRRPCGERELCTDTCECPGYHCHKCLPHQLGLNCMNPWKDCQSVYEAGHTKNGVYLINPTMQPGSEFKVFCDMNTKDKRWIVIQRRVDNTTNFDRTWTEYERGFGPLTGNFWLGLGKMHNLTAHGKAMLRVDLKHRNVSGKKFAEYSHFAVNNKDDKYRLSISGYRSESTAGDGMTIPAYDGILNLTGIQFSTHDNDNDKSTGGSCARDFKGGWWHNFCFYANLNGLYPKPEIRPTCQHADLKKDATYMTWTSIKNCAGGIVFSEMKIRYLDANENLL